MFRFILIVLLVDVVVGMKLSAKLLSQWKQFKTTHNKNYWEHEENARKEIFAKNVRDIEDHNLRADRGEETYHKGINQFTDMTREEFERTMLVPQKMYNQKIVALNDIYDPNLEVPAQYDARDHGIVTAVKNQGRGCGSCWAFAAVAAIEIAWAKANGVHEWFSEEQLIDCPDESKYNAHKCKIGNSFDALRYINDNGGINTERCYPIKYKANNGTTCHYNPNCGHALVNYGFYGQINDEEVLKQAVYNHGHVLAGLKTEKPFQDYIDGILTTPCYDITDDEPINHYVVIVGYGTDSVSGINYWQVKNSWGPGWGEGGYIRIIRNQNLCNLEKFLGYAVLQ